MSKSHAKKKKICIMGLNQQFHGILELLLHLGYAGDLASDRMNELRNEKVKVELLFCH